MPGELLVQFETRAGLLDQQNVMRQVGGQIKSVSPFSGVMRVQVPAGWELHIAEQLSRRVEVVYAEPNYVLITTDEPDDPYFPLQWNLHNTGQVVENDDDPGLVDADIDAPEAWDIHRGNGRAIVAIGDSGIDLDHQDLIDRIWVNPGEVPGNGLDDDNNGFVDDVNGWNFCASYPCDPVNNNNDTDDDDFGSHGTHVAGIAGATGNNVTGVSGVNWGTTLMPVKVVDQFGRGTVQAVADGIDYAANNGADVINLSVAGSATAPCDLFETIRDAMVRALEKGTLVVFSAGNYGWNKVACPAALEEAIAVGSSTNVDQRAITSNYGAELDVVAPGQSIYSAGRDNSYLYKSGTSMAAPHVAGLIGLLRSCSPALSAAAARAVMESTADDLGAPGRDDVYGFGRINAYQALVKLAQLQPITEPVRLMVADNLSSSLPVTHRVEMVTTDPTVISWTAVITPAVSWLSLGTAGQTSVSGTGVPLSVTLVTTRPTPAVTGSYSATLLFSAETQSGLALCPEAMEIQLNYLSSARLNYLPLIQRNDLSGPDLVVDALVATSTGVTVTVRNQGDKAVTDAFWVDVYFDPVQVPALNMPWPAIADTGQVWGVTADLLPGASLTLTSGGSYFSPDHSSPLPLPVGVVVYGLVDSVNFGTDYGNVLEQNEANNVSGAVVSVD